VREAKREVVFWKVGRTTLGESRPSLQKKHPDHSVEVAHFESTYEQQIVSLSEGDTIIVFSDGVTEVLNGREEEYGEDRLVAYGIAHKSLPAVDLVRGILQSVTDFSAGVPQADDVSVTVARYRAAGGEFAPSAGAKL